MTTLYAVVRYMTYYPSGGETDFKGVFATEQDAVSRARFLNTPPTAYDFLHVVKLEAGKDPKLVWDAWDEQF